ncbi:hypothetical protein BTS2_2758 [Bacillus sp. TS-2]|nr:hypothetical protein BTS2_2758 [Bacillus sp. TS-2]
MQRSTRTNTRKKERLKGSIYNISIALVVLLIVVVAYQIFWSDRESAVSDEEQEGEIASEELESELIESELDEESNNSSNDQIPNQTSNDGDEGEELREEDEDEQGEEEEANEEELELLEPVEDGKWQPIGTRQSGEFHHDFNRDSVNWQEMEVALKYATGLEDIIIWRLENGGASNRAVGVVSSLTEQNEPYRITIEFIEGQGWLPVEKEQLQENPYKIS